MGKFVVCQSCRKYGVKLIDNLCEACYYTDRDKITSVKPQPLGRMIYDIRMGKFRSDARTTGKDNDNF